jgi:hypothetical protein
VCETVKELKLPWTEQKAETGKKMRLVGSTGPEMDKKVPNFILTSLDHPPPVTLWRNFIDITDLFIASFNLFVGN